MEEHEFNDSTDWSYLSFHKNYKLWKGTQQKVGQHIITQHPRSVLTATHINFQTELPTRRSFYLENVLFT